MPTADVRRVVDAVWRMESAKLIAALTRVTGDVGLAEELAQDALVAALERWPESGIPDKPGAWLMATAKHRAIDTFRRSETLTRKTAELGRELEQREAEEPAWVVDLVTALDEVVEDDLLRLVFISCHPVLSREARVALTLRLLGGLTTDEIARAFLVAESTVAQRIVRAKRTLAAARVPFEVPTGAEFTGRLASVLEVIYLVFNEGYAATAGEHWTRPALCQEALRLGRILAELTPRESEVHGLVALMEIQASRLSARVGPNGEPVLLHRPGPPPLGPRPRHPRARRPRPRRADRGTARPVRAAGRDRRLPRPRRLGGDHRLGADRRPLRGAGRADAVPGRRAQPRRRDLAGVRAGRRAGTRRRA